MTQPALPLLALLPHVHDLPPTWDGQRVDWQGWSTCASSARFHGDPEPCDSCGCIDEPSVNLGILHPLPDEMTVVELKRKSRKSGRTYYVPEVRPMWPVVRLAAFRCPQCSHDQVLDNRDDSLWDLDASDYGDSGSCADAP